MMQKLESNVDTDHQEVQQLLEQRATVQGWLDRLDEQAGKVSEHVLERVRADYERRLQETLESLGSHRRALQAELERVTAELVSAEHDHRQARDELEERQLRNAIGEIDDAGWGEQSIQLQEAVDRAANQEDRVRAETERLRDLLEQLEERQPEAPAFSLEPPAIGASAALAAPAPSSSISLDPDATLEGFDDDLEDDFDDGDDGDIATDLDFAADPEDAGQNRPDAETTVASASLPTLNGDAEENENTAPRPGLKCAECGYTNDLSAWFCGVCGADVG